MTEVFTPIHTDVGVCVELHSWPVGVVETQYILVDGAWKCARRSYGDSTIFVFDAPEVTTRQEAEDALHRSFDSAIQAAASMRERGWYWSQGRKVEYPDQAR